EAADRSGPPGLGRGVELPRRGQVAVGGARQRIHAERLDPAEEVGDPVGAVEEGVLAVGVEVDERQAATALGRPAPRARGRGGVAWLRAALRDDTAGPRPRSPGAPGPRWWRRPPSRPPPRRPSGRSWPPRQRAAAPCRTPPACRGRARRPYGRAA